MVLLKGRVAGVGVVVGYLSRPRPAPAPPQPPTELPTTQVIVTACDRHLRFRDRFVWAGLAVALGRASLGVWAVLETRRAMGAEYEGLAVALLISAVFATDPLPLALSARYAFAGPVGVERVTEGTVVLDRVRQAYSDATGLRPTGAANEAA